MRKILIDLEAGKVVRAALDIQALIHKLEGKGKDSGKAGRFIADTHSLSLSETG